MPILAAFLDPSNDGFDLTDLASFVGLVLLIAGSVTGAVRWNAKRTTAAHQRERAEMEERIKAAVVFAAKDLQPKNGGTGWKDVHNKLDVVLDRQGEVLSDVQYLRARIDNHIDHDHERA